MIPIPDFPHRRIVVLACALTSLLASFAAPAQTTCGNNSPAYPVPEYRGATHLWPTNGFRPGQPSQTLAVERDSTQYTSNTFPSAASGHELFWGIDVVGDRAFVMYNVGISAWDLSGNYAENPRRVHIRDGILGDWFHHDGVGEADGFLKDLAAIQDPANPNQILIAVAGLSPIGATVWKFDRVTNLLSQAYQNTSLESEDVDLVLFGGKVYAFFAAGTGAFVVDATAASQVPDGCLDAACPGGLYLGKVGNAAGSRYLDAIERGGKVYMASANGGLTTFSPLPEIWELDPANPAAATRRWVGTVNDTHSPTLFTKGDTWYMAVVQARRVKIYNIGDCLDTNGCSSLPTAVFDHALRSQIWSYNFLSYSVSEGTPFLYYGFEGIFPKGPAYERLFDLTNLGTASPITEITETGETYTDACNGLGPIGYWAEYQESNDHGYRNYSPRKGKFSGRYFYKVNTGTFDVHVRTQIVQVPTITTTAASPGPYYFGDDVRFSASAQNCAGPESWIWNASNADATGLGSGSSTASINWALCGNSRCPSENVEVWALKDACAGSTTLVENRATVNLLDPRPQIDAINVTPTSTLPDTYPVCSVLSFAAAATGKAPLTYGWTVKNAAQQEIASGNAASFSWNTAGVSFGPEIFVDGFESGDTSAWTGERASSRAATTSPDWITEVMAAGSANFTVGLRLDNASASPATATRLLTLTALGPLGFVGSPIVATSLGSGQYRLQTTTANATRWRWEFEDPANGSTSGCLFYAKCRVIDYGADDNDVTTAWAAPNLDGTYRVRVSAANCLDVAPISAELSLNVTGLPSASPPAVTTFSIVVSENCSLSLNVMECIRGASLGFIVVHTGTASHYDFDWEGDGVFEQSLTVGAAITHTYTTTGTRFPKVRARNLTGTPSAAVGLPWALDIIP